MVKPVKTMDMNTLDLIRLLREAKASDTREDYFKEYDYDDIGS